MKKKLAKFLMACGESPKDGASNLAASLFAVSGLGGYLIANHLLDNKYGATIGIATVISGGITSWCTGKSDNLGLL